MWMRRKTSVMGTRRTNEEEREKGSLSWGISSEENDLVCLFVCSTESRELDTLQSEIRVNGRNACESSVYRTRDGLDHGAKIVCLFVRLAGHELEQVTNLLECVDLLLWVPLRNLVDEE
jgi:hypothetical protein